jgi:2-keto-4-pentenoate hydratase/2-oxohepta-3-ene-1,7-dioic acid hydratase in catechol pathway
MKQFARVQQGNAVIPALVGDSSLLDLRPLVRGPNPGVKLDWETELAIGIGREVQDIRPDQQEILAYFSGHTRMVPGDILATGTPLSVGMGKNRFLAVGDILECGITNLGAQRHEIVA